jgi:hypothetical protein
MLAELSQRDPAILGDEAGTARNNRMNTAHTRRNATGSVAICLPQPLSCRMGAIPKLIVDRAVAHDRKMRKMGRIDYWIWR